MPKKTESGKILHVSSQGGWYLRKEDVNPGVCVECLRRVCLRDEDEKGQFMGMFLPAKGIDDLPCLRAAAGEKVQTGEYANQQ